MSIMDDFGSIAKRTKEIEAESSIEQANASATNTMPEIIQKGGWQPITTAPKDGTQISLMNDKTGIECTGRWSLALTAWFNHDNGLVFDPTHWRMP